MSSIKKRKKYVSTNKYQNRIILLAFIPSMFICLVVAALVMMFHNDLIEVIVNQSSAVSIEIIDRWGALLLTVICVIFVAVLFYSFIISANMVGSFERIIRELDEVIDGKGRKMIVARGKDDLANDLLKRINVLIKSYQGAKK